MGDRALRTAALVAGVATVALAVAAAVLRTIGPATEQTFNVSSPFVFWFAGACASAYAVIGTVLARRLARHPVPWIFLGMGLTWSSVMLTWAYVIAVTSGLSALRGAEVAALINTTMLQPAGLTLGVLLLHLFPDGRVMDTVSRRALLLVPCAAAMIGLGVALTPGSIGIYAGLANPIAPAVSPLVGRAVTVVGALAIVGLLAVGFRSLWVRYRSADRVVRAQIRWFVWAGGIGASVAIGIVAILTIHPGVLTGPTETVLLVLFAAAAALMPIACAIAILRHGLYEIDRLISRTFVYGSLLAIVAGAYSAGIEALDRLFVAVTGERSDLVAVLTTLILAISFEPLKMRLTRFAERFGETAEPAPVPATLEDAWVDAVAARVIERLEVPQPSLKGPHGEGSARHPERHRRSSDLDRIDRADRG